ncbi:MAG TPA: hydrogen gas-evolving membrane-bound hydrogenase subunit E [Thermomicrobiales bacterium]|nr:hydrogen gas-evolving membrane-bound hydrogenase subunit E [Thermomicrobiales bacterium]
MSADAWLQPLPVLLVVAALAAPATVAAGRMWPRRAASAAQASAALALAAVLWNIARIGGGIDLPWLPSWGATLSFTFDGISALYTLLASGIGLAVFIYAGRYLPLHLHHAHRPATEATPFFALLTLFMGAMIGLATARDLLLLFIFWDLTAVASYGLIGFDHTEAARRGSLMALLVTVSSALLLLIGALILGATYGTFDIAALSARARPGAMLTIPVALMAVAALTKSAQVPFHFWLPRAMAAPTPVSAYLHSAAMVAAGVFLLGRLYPLIDRAPEVQRALVVVGVASMLMGGALALVKRELKAILAYSTIGQYGYVVVMLGLGGAAGVGGAAFYVTAHAIAKSALFLTAGAVTEATGRRSLDDLGGLARPLPALAIGSGLAAAALAALPLTIGFFKDEFFFEAAHHDGPVMTAIAVFGAALTLAYMARFWGRIFLGRLQRPAAVLPLALVAPIVVLGGLAVVGGVAPAPFAALATAAGSVSMQSVVALHPVYHLAATPANLMAVAAWAIGAALAGALPWWRVLPEALSAVGERIGPERWYWALLRSLDQFSDWLHALEVRDLRSRVASVLVPAGALVAAAVLATPSDRAFLTGSVHAGDAAVVLLLAIACVSAVAAAGQRDHVAMTLLLSGVGYSLAVVYAAFGAPDVTLVAVLMETLFALLFLTTLAALPQSLRQRLRRRPIESARHQRNVVYAVISGAAAFITVWGILSKPAAFVSVAAQQIELTPAAHAKAVVTAILADFRGLDTMGEITVIGVALLGLAALLARRRET